MVQFCWHVTQFWKTVKFECLVTPRLLSLKTQVYLETKFLGFLDIKLLAIITSKEFWYLNYLIWAKLFLQNNIYDLHSTITRITSKPHKLNRTLLVLRVIILIHHIISITNFTELFTRTSCSSINCLPESMFLTFYPPVRNCETHFSCNRVK